MNWFYFTAWAFMSIVVMFAINVTGSMIPLLLMLVPACIRVEQKLEERHKK